MDEEQHTEQRHEQPYIGDEFPDAGDRPATDASLMTEGVGGVPDIDDETRATVSDVDGDNVEPDPARSPDG